jgi:hypothetical protein
MPDLAEPSLVLALAQLTLGAASAGPRVYVTNSDEGITWEVTANPYVDPLPLPGLDQLRPSEELTVLDEEGQNEFFRALANGDQRLRRLNGVELGWLWTAVRVCDVCDERIGVHDEYWTRPLDGDDTWDACAACLPTLSEADRAHLTRHAAAGHDSDRSGFGSVFDWLPVIRSPDDDLVLVNRAVGPKAGRVALRAVDGHGRCGYFEVDMALAEVVAWLNAALGGYPPRDPRNPAAAAPPDEDPEDEDEGAGEPIKWLMERLGLETYFG